MQPRFALSSIEDLLLAMSPASSYRFARLMAFFAVLEASGCAMQPVELPSNVVQSRGPQGEAYIDKVDFSYARTTSTDFGKLKLCIAENVQHNETNLHDSAGSFVGRYTGTYYQTDHRQVIGGGQVFKLVDDASAVLIATGVTIVPPSGMALSPEYVRYELKTSAKDKQVGLTFFSITRAQQNSGILSNNGFQSVGIWPGSRASDVYASLERIANKIKNCLN